ncbi:MAG: hypothetical protein ACOCU1_02730 [Bacillota bacterium]
MGNASHALVKTMKKISKGLLILLLLIISTVGIFYNSTVTTDSSTNIYGDVVTFFGRGIYYRESMFKGPIYVGTDIVMMVIIITFIGLTFLYKDKENKYKIDIAYYTVFTYYTASLVFGTMMNELFLIYIIAFSLASWRLLIILVSLDYSAISERLKTIHVSKGHLVFLGIAGASTLVWLFEIVAVVFNGRPSDVIGMSATEPTYIIDLAFVLPACILSIIYLKKRKAIGAVLSLMMTALLSSIGLIVVSQTLVQRYYGVSIATSEFVVYVGSFIVLSIVASVFVKKSLKML